MRLYDGEPGVAESLERNKTNTFAGFDILRQVVYIKRFSGIYTRRTNDMLVTTDIGFSQMHLVGEKHLVDISTDFNTPLAEMLQGPMDMVLVDVGQDVDIITRLFEFTYLSQPMRRQR